MQGITVLSSSSRTSWCAAPGRRASSVAWPGDPPQPEGHRRRGGRSGGPASTGERRTSATAQAASGAARAARGRHPPAPGRTTVASAGRLAGCCSAGRRRHPVARPLDHRGATRSPRAARSRTALRLAVPIGLAGLGGLWSERAGVVNIGLEGMMILGTWFGAWAAASTAPGRASSRASWRRDRRPLHAIATVTFGVDHIISGVAINILAAGRDAVPRRAAELTGTERRGSTQSPPVPSSPPDRAGMANRCATSDGQHWFVISDIAGDVARRSPTDVSFLTVARRRAVPAHRLGAVADVVRAAAAVLRRGPVGC